MGFYSRFTDNCKLYDLNSILIITYNVLQREMSKEINSITQNKYSEQNVLNFSENEKFKYPFLSQNFHGQKLHYILNFYDSFKTKNYNEFWKSIADLEQKSIEKYILNISKKCLSEEELLKNLDKKNIVTKTYAKFKRIDKENVKDELENHKIERNYASNTLLTEWNSLAKENQLQYVALRYLYNRGSLYFNQDDAREYILNQNSAVKTNDIEQV